MALCALVVVTLLAALPLLPTTASAGDGQQVLCDRADYGCVEGTGYHGQSVWGANYGKTGHNCTSYVSYLLSQRGVAEPWHTMGNANVWDERAVAKSAGTVAVDDRPAVGSVAQWEGGTRYAPGPSGHVAYVEAVTAKGIEITEDQHSGGTRRARIDRGSPYWPSHFIHIHDLGPQSRLVDGGFELATSHRDPADDATELTYGEAGDVPVVGDWNGDGKDTVGVFHDGTWELSNGKKGRKLRTTERQLGAAGDTPVVGDWNGDGKDDVGVYRDGQWSLAAPTKADPKHTIELQLGGPGDVPVVGDWDGVDGDTVGTFHDGLWTLSNDLYGGRARRVEFLYGGPGDQPVTGNWDGVRGDSVGVYRGGEWTLTNVNGPSLRKLLHLTFGDDASSPLVGNWDGQGSDALGLSR